MAEKIITLRQYTSHCQFTDFGVSLPSKSILERAESDIDNVISNFYEGLNSKFLNDTFTYNNVVLTTTTATIPNNNSANGVFKYTVLTVLSGDKAGKRIPIKNNVGGVLEFAETIDGLSGTETVLIEQIGKFPMSNDCYSLTGGYYKVIPENVVKAVVYQCEYLTKNKTLLNLKSLGVNSHSVNNANYSVSFSNDSKSVLPTQIVDQRSLALIKEFTQTYL